MATCAVRGYEGTDGLAESPAQVGAFVSGGEFLARCRLAECPREVGIGWAGRIQQWNRARSEY